MVIMNEQNLLYGTQSISNLKVRHLSDFETDIKYISYHKKYCKDFSNLWAV